MFINLTKSDDNIVSINSDYIEYYEKTNGTKANTKVFCKHATFYVTETKEFIDNILINRQYA